VIILITAGIPSQWTHWLFYIDANGVYQPGTLYFLQFSRFVYYFAAMILTIRQIKNRKDAVNVLGKFLLFLMPTAIGTIINTRILRGGEGD